MATAKQDDAATIDDLKEQFAELRSDVGEIAKSINQIVNGEIRGAARRAGSTAEELSGKAKDAADRAKTQAEDALAHTRQFVAEKPILTAAIALAVGFALGAASRRR